MRALANQEIFFEDFWIRAERQVQGGFWLALGLRAIRWTRPGEGPTLWRTPEGTHITIAILWDCPWTRTPITEGQAGRVVTVAETSADNAREVEWLGRTRLGRVHPPDSGLWNALDLAEGTPAQMWLGSLVADMAQAIRVVPERQRPLHIRCSNTIAHTPGGLDELRE